ncbi:MAG: hypothetical protein EU535_08885 [Promethearchaeota archaeon]|nr:MAG: hypothetical protein EU535_08885 [Candidatus Lokiarchaeota archaeon]
MSKKIHININGITFKSVGHYDEEDKAFQSAKLYWKKEHAVRVLPSSRIPSQCPKKYVLFINKAKLSH